MQARGSAAALPPAYRFGAWTRGWTTQPDVSNERRGSSAVSGRVFDDLVEADFLRGLGHERRAETLLDGLLGHDALLDVATGRQLELHVEQGLLEDRAQAARPGLAGQGLVRNRGERLVGEDQLDAVELEEALELLHERVARLGEDPDQVVAAELVHGAHDRQAADELGDEPVVHEVLGQALLEDLALVALGLRLDRRAEADALGADPTLDDLD